jgi:hypothetical protein
MLALIGYCSLHLLAHVGHQPSGIAPFEAVLSADSGTADVSSEADSDEGDHGSAVQPVIMPGPADTQVSASPIDFPLTVDLPPRLRTFPY